MRSSPKSGQRNRKKHKRLDAISEAVYKQNHLQANDAAGPGPGSGESELRRSSRARRAPVVLDLSPGPPKKRRRVGKNGELSGRKSVKKDEEEGMEEGGWKSRLRARRRGSLRGKRRLFEEGSEDEEGLEGGRPKVVRSKTPGRVRATYEREDNELVEVKEEVVEDGDNLIQVDCEEGEEIERDTVEGESTKVVEAMDNLELEECIGNEAVEPAETADRGETVEQVNEQVEEAAGIAEHGETMEQVAEQMEQSVDVIEEENGDKQMYHEQVRCVVEGEDQIEAVEAVGVTKNEAEAEGCKDGRDSHLTEHDEKLAIEVNTANVGMSKVEKSQIKEGRRCGLCGGGTDGMPPKVLAQDTADFENEAYSGSSASEKIDYNTWDGFGDEPSWLGRLLGPINDRYGIAGTWVHQHCAVWSPEV